ncbi:hypothetical protein FNH22_12950 [Fulvivirga sp. M361]|uniref:hypothetical protein n=1 Tax=Fulvivirga sp. M361 TaxID=2594266 RepID=UPI00117A1193|nr:hypothetical protein [Fulvivirga sp. M361]TRX58779.1 hypothetical protein FNH22_12950 [Fulvivirga sp. M361]
MNYLTILPGLLLIITFSACEGPEGIPGPRGPQGAAGGDIGFVMEWVNVDFTASNEYRDRLAFSDFEFEALESDVVLVFFRWSPPSAEDEIWRPLPQTLIVEEGLLQYNYDFTLFDVEVFMDADFNLNTLPADDTDDWVVRVVVVPGEFVGGRKAARTWTYEELVDKFDLPEPVSM